MVNKQALEEIERLEQIYKQRWNTSVDTSLLPRTVTQEQLCLILRRIIDTGESCLVGYSKIKEITWDYYNQIDWTHSYKDGDVFDKKCPFCGNRVKIAYMGTYGQTNVIYCESDLCLRIVSRGL